MDISGGEEHFKIVLPIVTISLILIFLLIFIYLSRDDFDPTSGNIPCGPGLCANDVYSGEKTCPTSSSSVSYNPGFQDCNPPTGCQPDSRAPCLYYDITQGTICPGDPNYNNGVCPQGISSNNCKCTSRIYCPDFATVYFRQKTVTTPGVNEPCTNLVTLVQETTWTDAANLPRNDLPLSPGSALSPEPTFCGVKASNLQDIWPSSTCLRGTLALNQEDNLYYCMNIPQNINCTLGQVPVRVSDGNFICESSQNLI